MASSLLNVPPELLVNILSFLPIRELLRFSETCRYSHSVAKSSLHTLSIGIHPTRVSGMISRMAATQYPQPNLALSSFMRSMPNTSPDNDDHSSGLVEDCDPYKVSVFIPEAQIFDYMTLLSFHTALMKSILIRHGGTLRNLELSLWTLTKPIAKALSSLPALRALSIRVEDFPHVRAVPRKLVPSQRIEQREAWIFLTKHAVWARRLHALRIEGSDITLNQLKSLLIGNHWLRELWLCKCSHIDSTLWSFLGCEWEGRAALRILGVMRCGGQLDEEALNAIGNLNGLQFLSLHGCTGLDCEAVEIWNRDFAKIPEVVPPLPRVPIGNANTIIEVDPLYLESDDS